MAYMEVSVVVDGAVDPGITFHDDALMADYIEDIRQDAESDGLPTEVYILYHNHEDDMDACSCVQYVTDHRPAYSWNM